MDTRRSDSPQDVTQGAIPQPPVSGDQNVIFSPGQPSAPPAQPTSSAPAQQPAPPSSEIPPGPPPQNPPGEGVKKIESIEEEKNRLPALLKMGGGIFALLIILFLIFAFVLPRLFTQKTGKVTLQWWGLWEDPAVMQTLISQFEQTHPNIVVTYVKEDPKQYSERLLTRIENGSGPDIFRFHQSWIPMMRYFLSPLSTDVISKQDFTKNYYPVIQQDLVKNGAILGIPLEIDTLSLFTNNQLFQSTGLKPPANWQDFITAARALTVKDTDGKIKTAGAALGTFDNITHAPDIVSLLLFQNNADILNLANTKQNASDALKFYTTFANGDSNVWNADLDPSITAFAKGNLAMYFGFSYDIFTIKSLNPNIAFSITSVPHLLGRNVTIASYWVEGVSNRSKHQKEAMEFMNFLSQKDTEQKLYSEEAKTRLFGEPYARVDLADSLKGDPLAYPFIQQAPSALSSFFAGETYDTGINAQMNGYLGNAVREVLSNASPQTAASTLAQGVAQVLNQYAAPIKSQ